MRAHEQSFVDRAVAHQIGPLGVARFCQSQAAFERAVAASSGGTLAWSARANAPYGLNGWHLPGAETGAELDELLNRHRFVNRKKHVPVAAEILRYGAGFDFLVDMQDRRARNVLTEDQTCLPVFAFNRIAGQGAQVLWPLPIYHDLGSDPFLGNVDPGAVAWGDKKEVMVWRGITGGRASGDKGPTSEGTRLTPLLKKLRAGRVSEAHVEAQLQRFPRYRAVARARGDARFDFGFVDGDGYTIADTPFHADLEAPRLGRREMQGYKYIAVLRGLDVGSSFFWSLNSGSVVFSMETPFETFGSCHFEPWEHYIPFAEDLSDLDERFDWAQAHDGACCDMARAAGEICALLGRADLRQRINRAVVEEIAAHLG